MTEIIEKVRDVIEPVLDEQGYMLWAIEYEQMDGDMVLRTLVDRKSGAITMDDLVHLTEIIGELIDTIQPDPFPAAYMLDVSSPGAERPLSQMRDYEWALHQKIVITLKDTKANTNDLAGELIELKENGVIIRQTIKNKNVLTPVAWSEIQGSKLALVQDRSLNTDEDFNWALNKLVQVSTYQKIDGEKVFKGELVDFDSDQLVIENEDQTFVVPRNAIAKARQVSTD
ncbi:ribosome maturation factor [Weissella coleopterorum]|uniref:Ribosome maturation factor RimP n=1 Tax=Weissella coleopterorum TaxID=2714949 RepID=A0A6G8B0X7_9LACO|nr:ribosome maturation factor [Weissella coleopterorum]QIL50964.1 ribosome maturation factor [Weissella coleopterorum]